MVDYTKIQLKRSAERNKKPLVSDLDYGELALNYQNGKLYLKVNDSDGVSIVEIQNFNKDVQFFSNVTLGDGPGDQIIVNGNADFNDGIDVVGNSNLENTTIAGSLNVDSDLSVSGKGQIGLITFDSDTISTTSGNLKLNSNTGYVQVTNDLLVDGDLVVAGGFSAGSSGVTLPAGSVTLGLSTQGAYVRSVSAGNGIRLTQSNIDSESNDVSIALSSLALPDNIEISFGTDSDLLIYHDGTNSVISNSTGNLELRSPGGNIIIDSANNRFLFQTSAGVNLMSLDSSGNLITTGNITSQGTIT